MQKYKYRQYNQNYSDIFQKYKVKLNQILSENVKIEHVGSTAIKGLGGKGIIDIIISSNQLNYDKMKLNKAHYFFRPKAGTDKRLFFRKDIQFKNKTYRLHLHLTKYQGKDWQEMINFRENLNKNSDLVQQYIKIKKQAVKKAKGDKDIYNQAKYEFIKKYSK